jgi:hypothetical protein
MKDKQEDEAPGPTGSTMEGPSVYPLEVPSRKELISLLHVPEHLTTHSKNLGIKQHYVRYKACLEAQQILNEMVRAGSWPGKKPTENAIIELFGSKTYWFTYVKPAFKNINNFPVLKDWLEDEGVLSDMEVWGKQKSFYTFIDLMELKKRDVDKGEKENKKGGKGKAKGDNGKTKEDKGKEASRSKKRKKAL